MPTAENDPPGSAEHEAERRGCLNLGWGCLPVVLGFLVIPILGFLA